MDQRADRKMNGNKKVFLFSDKAYYFIWYITDTDRRNGRVYVTEPS